MKSLIEIRSNTWVTFGQWENMERRGMPLRWLCETIDFEINFFFLFYFPAQYLKNFKNPVLRMQKSVLQRFYNLLSIHVLSFISYPSFRQD